MKNQQLKLKDFQIIFNKHLHFGDCKNWEDEEYQALYRQHCRVVTVHTVTI